jgi:hypothetical protein
MANKNDAVGMAQRYSHSGQWTALLEMDFVYHSVMEFSKCDRKDFIVLLQKETGEEGEYTIVTKEWLPAMLEHYDY